MIATTIASTPMTSPFQSFILASPAGPAISGGAPAGIPTTGEQSQPIGGAGSGTGAAKPVGGGSMLPLMLAMGALFVVMIFMSGRTQKRERKQRNAMLAALNRNDRVQTNGGIIGTVTDIHDDTITLKVDEATNTRIQFARSAIGSVLKSARRSDEDELEDDKAQLEHHTVGAS